MGEGLAADSGLGETDVAVAAETPGERVEDSEGEGEAGGDGVGVGEED